jgi:dTDP-4-dehydrorhamnose 3,5-epimerase
VKIKTTDIADLLIIEPLVHGDSRGYFFESYNDNAFKEYNLKYDFIQDNEAKSKKGVLRGLHFQYPPHTQTKLIRAISGEILDAVVDLRINSKTYGRVFTIKLNDHNKTQLLVPKGFAHGYIVLSEEAIVAYKVDEKYMALEEGGLAWNDQILNIDWLLDKNEILLSEKDKQQQFFKNFKSPFI